MVGVVIAVVAAGVGVAVPLVTDSGERTVAGRPAVTAALAGNAALFRRARTAEDQLDGELVDMWRNYARGAELPVTSADAARSVRVATLPGQGDIFAIPVRPDARSLPLGGIVIVTEAGAISAYGSSLSDTSPITMLTWNDASLGVSAFGLASDRVREVSVVAGGRRHKAAIRDNVWYWAAGDSDRGLSRIRIVATLVDGSQVRVG